MGQRAQTTSPAGQPPRSHPRNLQPAGVDHTRRTRALARQGSDEPRQAPPAADDQGRPAGTPLPGPEEQPQTGVPRPPAAHEKFPYPERCVGTLRFGGRSAINAGEMHPWLHFSSPGARASHLRSPFRAGRIAFPHVGTDGIVRNPNSRAERGRLRAGFALRAIRPEAAVPAAPASSLRASLAPTAAPRFSSCTPA